MPAIFPSALILINNDLTDNTRNYIVKQLHINTIMDGYSFDGYITANPTWISTIHEGNMRVMVVRPFTEFNNREIFDVVIFVKAAMATILQNNFGPPRQIWPLLNLTWSKLGIYG